MPSVLSHPAVPVAMLLAGGSERVGPRLFWAAAAASVAPDLDVIGFCFGIPYDSLLGHRGFSHSLAFAAVLGAVAARAASALRAPPRTCFVVVGLAAASHGLLDGLTTGGRGIA